MPRVADIYSRPAGIDAVPNATIESVDYNANVADVEADLNLPRPIVAGGTGATSAVAARGNLQTEVATQVVTNFDTHNWEAGSFKSAIGATGAPNGTQNFSGVCHLFDPTSLFLEARAYEGNQERYTRRKYGNVWYPWTSGLTIPSADNSVLVLNKAAGAYSNLIAGQTAGKSRWLIELGNSVAETGGNAGSNFTISRYSDTGSLLATALTINRTDGSLVYTGNANFAGTLASSTSATTGVYYLGSNGTKHLSSDGTNFIFTGGPLIAIGSSISNRAVSGQNVSYSYQDEGGTAAISTYWDRANGSWNVRFPGVPATPDLQFSSGGQVKLSLGFASRNGTAGVYQSNVMNFHYNANVYSFVDSTNMGIIQFVSDYRTKKDVEDLPGTWETVKALRPIKYTQADYTPEGATNPLFVADNKERWGFIAHELQDTLIEDAATGHKDASGLVQSPNPWTMIAALTKALQETMARIEALEARQ